MDNFKIPEYKELLNLTAQCKEDSNFPCIAKFLKTKIMNEGDKEYTLKLIQFLNYISEYITESRGPLYYLKSCQKFVDIIVDEINDGDSLNLSIEDKINILMNGFLPYFKVGDRVNIDKSENGSIRLKHNGKDLQYNFVNSPSDPSDRLPLVSTVTKVREAYIELEGSLKFSNTTHSSKFLILVQNIRRLRYDADQIKKMIEKTPYASSIPSEKEGDDLYIIGLCIVIMKAILHEKDILRNINNDLGHAVEAEIDDTNHINWSKILKICNESVLKLKRKCDKCDKAKFKRFPAFDIFSLREKYLTQVKIQQKALYKKKKDERRWPGYPNLTEDDLNEKYEERGTGPEFNVVVEDGKRRLNNILDNVVVNDKNENAVTIIDNGVEKIINKDDKEWNYYFGPFSKENQLKLQLAQQRMKENNEKMIKMQNKNKEDEFLKKIMSGKSVDLIMPDGTAVILKELKEELKKEENIIFYDHKTKRIYPPINVSFDEAKGKTYHLAFVSDLENLTKVIQSKSKCLIEENMKFMSTNKFGFKKEMYSPFPRKKLGIDLNFKNLSNNKDVRSELYYVSKEDFESFLLRINETINDIDVEIYELTKHPTLQLIFKNKDQNTFPFLKNKQNGKEYVLIKKGNFDAQHKMMKLSDAEENNNHEIMIKGFNVKDDEDFIRKLVENMEINSRI